MKAFFMVTAVENSNPPIGLWITETNISPPAEIGPAGI
jgi:hypothetical protein